MNYEQYLQEQGYIDRGPCGCHGMKGNDYQHPQKEWLSIRVFRKNGIYRILEYGVVEATKQLSAENIESTVNHYK